MNYSSPHHKHNFHNSNIPEHHHINKNSHFSYNSSSPPLTRYINNTGLIKQQPRSSNCHNLNQFNNYQYYSQDINHTSSLPILSPYNSLPNPQSLPSNDNVNNMNSPNTSIIRVNLTNGTSKSIRYDSQTNIEKVIHVLLAGLNIDSVSNLRFSLRLTTFPHGQGVQNNESIWLHPKLIIQDVLNLYFLDNTSKNHLKFELRMRFIPDGLQEMYQAETDAFLYLYEQLKSDYLAQIAWRIDGSLAIEIGSILLRKRFSSLTPCNIEKKLNFDIIDKEGGLKKYFPEGVVVNEKPKNLRKMIVNAVKKYSKFSEIECIFKFMQHMIKLAHFDTEIFRVSLDLERSLPAELYVGASKDVSYKTECMAGPVKLFLFKEIIEIRVKRLYKGNDKSLIIIKVSGSNQPILLILSTLEIAFNLAHLLDGYQALIMQHGSVWNVKNILLGSPYFNDNNKIYYANPHLPNTKKSIFPIDTASSSSNSSPIVMRKEDLKIDRKKILLEELLGEGHFGNVYRGSFTDAYKNIHNVAIKVCKSNTEQKEIDNFVKEAHLMYNFCHPHIIKLIGICEDNPVWIVMELSSLGELRQYLIRQKYTIDLYTQILFSYQLSTALKYLHDKKFVHRDIAARNVLVSSVKCVKLSDFGLSRFLQDEDYYTSEHSKLLPIKWMAPESINYRKFDSKTDVWMFGVCIWEILSYGIKPWQNIRNHEVILKLDKGIRLEVPNGCPLVIYDLLYSMWSYDKNERPTMEYIQDSLYDFIVQLEKGIPYNKLEMIKNPITNNINNIHGDKKCSVYKPIGSIKLDTTQVEPTFLIKTLEQQRLQSEEDEKWLNDFESGNFTKDEKDIDSGKNSESSGCGYQFDREHDTIYKTVTELIECITNFNKNYKKSLSNDDFVRYVSYITNALKNLFHESTKNLILLEEEDRKCVEKAETLLAENMNEMAKAMAYVVEPFIGNCDVLEESRLEVLKVTHMLAINSKHYLESFDNARLKTRYQRRRKRYEKHLNNQDNSKTGKINYC
uniref:Protein kinase domain-containing protein n=1 Tax=Strongyloides stercoralis TaxID=6248 RepID=A0AAF5DCX9_STRER